MSSIIPPKALAPTNTGSNPKRPVLARGKSAAKAEYQRAASAPGAVVAGIATVKVSVTASVRG